MNELTSTPHDHSSGAEFTYRIDGNIVSIEALKWAGIARFLRAACLGQ